MGLIGALGITPIDFVLPCIFHLTVRKPRGLLRYVDIFIIFVYTCVGILGTVSSIRSIVVVRAGLPWLAHADVQSV